MRGSSGPEIPSEPPEPGTSVLIRYHSSNGRDGAAVGEVVDVSEGPGGYALTASKDYFTDVMVDTDTLAVTSTFPPDEDENTRLGVLKVIRPAPEGEPPEVDQQVDRFNRISSLVCGECGSGNAVVRAEAPHCLKCGARIDMEAAEQRRDDVTGADTPSPEELDAGPVDLYGHRVGRHDVRDARGTWVCLDCGKRTRWKGIFRAARCSED